MSLAFVFDAVDNGSVGHRRDCRGGELWDRSCSLHRHAPPIIERYDEQSSSKAGRMKRATTAIGLALSLLIGVSGSMILFPHTVGARTAHVPTSLRLTRTARTQALHVSTAAVSRRVVARARVLRQTGQQRVYRTALYPVQRVSRGSVTRRYGAVSASATGTTTYARYGTLTRTVRYGSAVRYAVNGTGRSCPHMSTSTTGR